MNEEILRNADLKSTKKRQIIIDILQNEPCPVSAEYVFEKTNNIIPISLSTVYRALNALSAKKILIKNVMQDGKTYFKLASKGHEHILMCSLCHESIAIDDCPFDSISEEIKKQTGYVITGHSLEYTGICPKCLKNYKND